MNFRTARYTTSARTSKSARVMAALASVIVSTLLLSSVVLGISGEGDTLMAAVSAIALA